MTKDASIALRAFVRRSLSAKHARCTSVSVTIAASAPTFAVAEQALGSGGRAPSECTPPQPDGAHGDAHGGGGGGGGGSSSGSSKRVLQSVGEQLSFGAVLGFATGYSMRKIGKLVLLLVGTEVVVLQYMAYRQWLVMDWRRLGADLSPKFERSAWDGLVNILLYKMPFSAAFSGGLVAALRLSSKK